MRDEILKADPVLGITLEEVVEEVSELGRGATGNPRRQARISLIELLEGLGSLGLEGSLARQTLEDYGAKGPEVGLGVILQRHDHLRGHVHRAAAQGGRHHPVLQESSKPKVGDLEADVRRVGVPRLAVVGEQDVLGLEITVDDSFAVHCHHCPG